MSDELARQIADLLGCDNVELTYNGMDIHLYDCVIRVRADIAWNDDTGDVWPELYVRIVED